jgi:hypothetical protein
LGTALIVKAGDVGQAARVLGRRGPGGRRVALEVIPVVMKIALGFAAGVKATPAP